MEKSVVTPNGKAANTTIAVIRVKGYLDAVTSDELDSTIAQLIKAKRFDIIVDLSEVEYISSMGWSVFLSKITDIRKNCGELRLACMQPNVYEVFRILEFDLFLSHHASVDEAASQFGLNGNTVIEPQSSAI